MFLYIDKQRLAFATAIYYVSLSLLLLPQISMILLPPYVFSGYLWQCKAQRWANLRVKSERALPTPWKGLTSCRDGFIPRILGGAFSNLWLVSWLFQPVIRDLKTNRLGSSNLSGLEVLGNI